jgi:hypothetical protein
MHMERVYARVHRAALACVLIAAAACGPRTDAGAPRAAEGSGPALQRLWTVRVEESDTAYLGRPSEFSVEPTDGSFYVADRFFGRVVRIGRDGRVLRTYGRKGAGPGELVDVGHPFAVGGRLFVTDVGRGHLSEFNASTGAFRRNYRYQGMLTSAEPGPDGNVWLGLQNAESRTGAAHWSAGTDTFRHFAGLPLTYRQSQPLAGIYTGVSVTSWADTVLVGYQGSDDLVLFSTGGHTLDTLRVPVARRRGVPADIVARLEKLQFPEMFRTASFLFAARRLPSGELGLVHFDQEIEGRSITSTVYVSALSADLRRACVDALLPATPDAQPHVSFRGDTLFVLEQRLDPVSDRPVTTISAHRVSTRRCRWIPLD